MSIADQIVTLSAVVVGATASYLVTSLSERARYQLEVSNRWEDRRFEVYRDYISQVKDLVGIARRLAGSRGLQSDEAILAPEEGLPLLDQAEARREVLTESITLLAGPNLILAYRRLAKVLQRIEWFARGMIPEADSGEFSVVMDELDSALNEFHACAREELGVPGEYIARVRPERDGPIDWIEETRSR